MIINMNTNVYCDGQASIRNRRSPFFETGTTIFDERFMGVVLISQRIEDPLLRPLSLTDFARDFL